MAEDIFERLVRCTGFDWDEANAPKLRERHEVSRLAHEQDVPYQSLMKVYLAERVAQERRLRKQRA